MLSEAPGGIHIVLKGKAPNGVPLVAVGYCYNAKTKLYSVMMEVAGTVNLGDQYEMKYTDMHGNVHVRMWIPRCGFRILLR